MPSKESTSDDNCSDTDRPVTGVTVALQPPDTDYCTEVLLAIADAINTEPSELPPLRESVDPDLINDVLQNSGVRRPSRTERLSFEYADMEVTIYSDETLHLKPLK